MINICLCGAFIGPVVVTIGYMPTSWKCYLRKAMWSFLCVDNLGIEKFSGHCTSPANTAVICLLSLLPNISTLLDPSGAIVQLLTGI